jgi:glycine/D-amino acid oxidase-like deaminating enzyme
MAEDILPFAWQAYTELGHQLNIAAISQKTLLDFFPTPQMRASFLERVEEESPYLHAYPEQNKFNGQFQYDFGCGETRPVYVAHLETVLPAWRAHLSEAGILAEEAFVPADLDVQQDHILYRGIKAKKIIFCDGNASAASPYFSALPFAPNKGEVLVVDIPGLPAQHIYKKGMMLVPLDQPDRWWVGSSYAWAFDHDQPTPDFLERTSQLLKNWLKVPFTVREHLAAVRPATLERRPFAGLHPRYPAIGILNGMGTKGCSLAPFFAKQLSDHLVYNLPMTPEADVARFARLLSRAEKHN